MANPHPIEIFKTLKSSISGNLSEKTIAYRRRIDVDFVPLGYDKTLSYWLYGFMKGSARQVTIGATTYDVTVMGSTLQFDFQNGTFFGDAFSISFCEGTPSYITDTASTRILVPLYSPVGEGISSETGSVYVNLCDDLGIEVIKYDLDFVDFNKEDLSYAYRHVITIDTGPVIKTALKDWLDEFVQWGSKQIDTTSIDPVNGQVYDVVFAGDGIDWQLVDSVHNIVSAVLVFKETTPRTTAEVMAIAPIYDEVVFDEVVAQ
jgi:hypothetical protein